ncbi:hypothetical protein EB835_15785 [Brevibacterium sp. S22]|nr:hypothetical protein EB835_15785 [Brevibacterium sp. S22]
MGHAPETNTESVRVFVDLHFDGDITVSAASIRVETTGGDFVELHRVESNSVDELAKTAQL